MKTYSLDNEVFVVRSAAELVQTLRADSRLSPASSEKEWMEEVAGRAQQSTGKIVRIDNVKNFVADLIEAGLIREEKQ